jgi:hypothetical protein
MGVAGVADSEAADAALEADVALAVDADLLAADTMVGDEVLEVTQVIAAALDIVQRAIQPDTLVIQAQHVRVDPIVELPAAKQLVPILQADKLQLEEALAKALAVQPIVRAAEIVAIIAVAGIMVGVGDTAAGSGEQQQLL